jgi:hypothetical protein
MPEHRFVADARVSLQAVKAAEQQTRLIPTSTAEQLGLPASRYAPIARAGPLRRAGSVRGAEASARSGRRALRPSILTIDAELRLELLHGVSRRLVYAKRRRLRIAAGLDNRNQRTPLIERNLGLATYSNIRLIKVKV